MKHQYNPITKEELKAKLQSHSCWLQDSTTGERLDLSMFDLSNMDLRGAYLLEAVAEDACFDGANLSGAVASFANMSGSSFKNASLSKSIFKFSDFSDCDFKNADINNAILWYSDFNRAQFKNTKMYGVKTTGAKFEEAILYQSLIIIQGERYRVAISDKSFVQVGCEHHSASEWRAFTKNEILLMDGRAALKFYPRLLDILDFYTGKGPRPDWVVEVAND